MENIKICKFYVKTDTSPKDICTLTWRDRMCLCSGKQIVCDYRFMLHDTLTDQKIHNENNKP